MPLIFCYENNSEAVVKSIESSLSSKFTRLVDKKKLVFDRGNTLCNFYTLNKSDDFLVFFIVEDLEEPSSFVKFLRDVLVKQREIQKKFSIAILITQDISKLEHCKKILKDGNLVHIDDVSGENVKFVCSEIEKNVELFLISDTLDLYWSKDSNLQGKENHSFIHAMSKILSMPIVYQQIVIPILFEKPLGQLEKFNLSGEFPLTSDQYFDAIISEIQNAKSSTEIYAIATMPASLWNNNKLQRFYADLNSLHAKLNSNIKRLFIVQDKWNSDFYELIKQQSNSKIDVKVNNLSFCFEPTKIKDIVVFKDENGSRAYVANPALDADSEVASTWFIVSENLIDRENRLFKENWNSAKSFEDFYDGFSTGYPEKPLLINLLQFEDCEYLKDSDLITQNDQLKNNLIEILICRIKGVYIAVYKLAHKELSLEKMNKHSYFSLFTPFSALGPSEVKIFTKRDGPVSIMDDCLNTMTPLISRSIFEVGGKIATRNLADDGYIIFPPEYLYSRFLTMPEVEDIDA